MPVQVIVTKDDRVWDSIKETGDQAMFRVTEHMKKDHEQEIAAFGDLVQWKMIFGKGIEIATKVLNEHDFNVQVKELNQGE